MSGSGGVARIGVCTPSAALLGTDALGAGDVVACAALREEDALVFSLNGAPLGIAFRLSELGLLGVPLCPALASRGAHVEITTADAWERSLLPVYTMEHVADENARALRRAADGEVAAGSSALRSTRACCARQPTTRASRSHSQSQGRQTPRRDSRPTASCLRPTRALHPATRVRAGRQSRQARWRATGLAGWPTWTCSTTNTCGGRRRPTVQSHQH